jgi:hypothetical protein
MEKKRGCGVLYILNNKRGGDILGLGILWAWAFVNYM